MLTECLTDCMYNWVAYMHGSITDLCSVLLYSGAGDDISSVYYCVSVNKYNIQHKVLKL